MKHRRNAEGFHFFLASPQLNARSSLDQGLGWAAERIVVIDEDQGLSGRTADNRAGFQRLMAEVSLNHVGVVLGLELSRLSRSNKDWHQLLELCGIFRTLLADQDGLEPGMTVWMAGAKIKGGQTIGASDEFGSPDRAVGPEKREHLERVARYYARQAGIEWGHARFDIVNVLLTSTPRIELLRDAFRSGWTL